MPLFPASVAGPTDKNKHGITELPLEQTASGSSTRGQTKCVWHSQDVIQVDVSPGQDHQKRTQGFCAADARAGAALTRVELQLPWSGAGRVTEHGGKTGWMWKVRSIACCLMAGD